MFRLSCDDGCASDQRLASLALKYNVPVTFYWPVEWRSLAYEKGYEPLTFQMAKLISKQFEVGSHTITHRHLTAIPGQEAVVEIAESQQILQEMFNKEITKFAAPRGYTNEELTKFTLKIYDSQRLTKGEGLLHIHPNSGANGNIPWREYAKTHDITEAWCHSWELDKYPEEWLNLENWLKEITGVELASA